MVKLSVDRGGCKTINQMEQRELLMNFMRSLKAKGLLDKDIHGSVVDVFIHSELPRLATNDVIADVSKRAINPNHRAKSDCCNSDMDLTWRDCYCNKCGKSCTWHTIDITTGEPVC